MVVFPPVVRTEEDLHATPRDFNGVSMRPGVRIDEPDAVVDGMVRVTLRLVIVVRRPAITDDCSAGFEPVTYDVHQRVSGSVPYGNKKCPARPSFHTAKHPLTLNRVSPMILSPNELALVNFDGPVRLGPPILTEQLSMKRNIASLQNMPQSATACALRRCSC